MELRISENEGSSRGGFNGMSFEDVPENIPVKKVSAINVVKQQQYPEQTVKSSLSGVKARMVRPSTPSPKPNISYDDILTKMGMYLENGKLHLISNKAKQPLQQPKT